MYRPTAQCPLANHVHRRLTKYRAKHFTVPLYACTKKRLRSRNRDGRKPGVL